MFNINSNMDILSENLIEFKKFGKTQYQDKVKVKTLER